MYSYYVKSAPREAFLDMASAIPVVQTAVGLSQAVYHTAMMVYELGRAIYKMTWVDIMNTYSKNDLSFGRYPSKEKEIPVLPGYRFDDHVHGVERGISTAIPIWGTVCAISRFLIKEQEYKILEKKSDCFSGLGSQPFNNDAARTFNAYRAHAHYVPLHILTKELLIIA